MPCPNANRNMEMRRDHRPHWMLVAETWFEAWWTRAYLAPQFERLGEGTMVRRPWYVEVYGPGIEASNHLHVHAEAAARVRLSTWAMPARTPPQIRIGDHVLIMPGAMINAARSIEIGDDCMLASHAVVSDSDWHG